MYDPSAISHLTEGTGASEAGLILQRPITRLLAHGLSATTALQLQVGPLLPEDGGLIHVERPSWFQP